MRGNSLTGKDEVMRKALSYLFCIAIGATLTLTVAAQQAGRNADEVIEITKAEWESIMAKKASAAMKNVRKVHVSALRTRPILRMSCSPDKA